MDYYDSDDEGELLTEAEESDDEMNFLFDQEGAAQPQQAKECSWTVIDQHKLEEVQASWGMQALSWLCASLRGELALSSSSPQQSRPFLVCSGCHPSP